MGVQAKYNDANSQQRTTQESATTVATAQFKQDRLANLPRQDMTEFFWKDRYCVGDATIDTQHRYLFDLANDAVRSKAKVELTQNVMKLFRYVREHFAYEEEVMRLAHYPNYKEHLKLHEELVSELSAIGAKIHDDRWPATELARFMEYWLLVHIVTIDSELAAYLKEN
jgi:hemerythrin